MRRRFSFVDSMSKKSQLILLVVIGLVMGTVFVFGVSYWSGDVERSECVQSYPIYESHKLVRDGATVKEIIIYFSNEEQMTIDSVLISDELISGIEELDNNSKIIVLRHPNSDTITEMIANGNVILDFDVTMNKLTKERNGFMIVGCFMYLFAIVSAIALFKKK